MFNTCNNRINVLNEEEDEFFDAVAEQPADHVENLDPLNGILMIDDEELSLPLTAPDHKNLSSSAKNFLVGSANLVMRLCKNACSIQNARKLSLIILLMMPAMAIAEQQDNELMDIYWNTLRKHMCCLVYSSNVLAENGLERFDVGQHLLQKFGSSVLNASYYNTLEDINNHSLNLGISLNDAFFDRIYKNPSLSAEYREDCKNNLLSLLHIGHNDIIHPYGADKPYANSCLSVGNFITPSIWKSSGIMSYIYQSYNYVMAAPSSVSYLSLSAVSLLSLGTVAAIAVKGNGGSLLRGLKRKVFGVQPNKKQSPSIVEIV